MTIVVPGEQTPALSLVVATFLRGEALARRPILPCRGRYDGKPRMARWPFLFGSLLENLR